MLDDHHIMTLGADLVDQEHPLAVLDGRPVPRLAAPVRRWLDEQKIDHMLFYDRQVVGLQAVLSERIRIADADHAAIFRMRWY